MPDEGNPFPAPGPGFIAPEIPDLKHKEKEKKKSGVVWGEAPVGAARAAASIAEAGAPEAAAAGMGLAGKLLAALLAAGALGGAGLVGINLMRGSGGSVGGGPKLDDMTSTIKVPKQAEDSLRYAAASAKGELKFEQANKSAGAEATIAAEQAPEQKPAERAAPASDQADQGAAKPQDQFAHNIGGAKLSTSLGGSFGGKNIFAGGGAPKFGKSFNPSILSKAPGGRGKLTAMAKPQGMGVGGASHLKGFGGRRALGQLRGMAPYNKAMRSGGPGESQANAASTQFTGDQGKLAAPAKGDHGADQLPAVNPMGGGGAQNDASQLCQQMASEGYFMQGGKCVHDVQVSETNPAKWKADADLAAALVKYTGYLLTGILMLAMIIWMLHKTLVGLIGGRAVQAALWALAATLIGVGGTLLYLGARLAGKYGQTAQGNMAMVIGGVMLASGALFALDFDEDITIIKDPIDAALVVTVVAALATLITPMCSKEHHLGDDTVTTTHTETQAL